MRLTRPVAVGLMLLLIASAAGAQSAAGRGDEKAARRFVTRFYDWYARKAAADNHEAAFRIALRENSGALSTELISRLREDAEAQDKVEGVTVGLDSDPFLDTQDPCARYRVGKIVSKGASYLVDIHRTCFGKSVKPDVVAEVVSEGGRWHFVNFRYSDGDDLLSLLKRLAESRSSSSELQ